jgi:hypothetical protein
MRDIDEPRSAVNSEDGVVSNDKAFVWGARAIGQVIGRTERQAHHLLERRVLKSAQKKGGRWVANRAALIREFGV